jgi:hypothetical protein
VLQEKESRSLAQQKIDSQLLYALKMDRGESIAPNVQSLDVNVAENQAGQVVLDITANVDDALINSMRASGAEIISEFAQYRSVRARVPLDQLETIANLPQVVFISRNSNP